jgi:polyisoprenoid-binding protein YceI
MMQYFFKLIFCLLFLSCTSKVMAEPDIYRIDDTHSFANWTIRHVASKTSGTFSEITGKITLDSNNLANSSVEAKVNMLSVNSSHPKRDENIKKPEYLDVDKFAEMTFLSQTIVQSANNKGIITGIFTLHGVSKQISFPFKVLGYGDDPWGGRRVGIEAFTSLKASDYGFGWGLKPNAPIGDDIEITLLIEGVKIPTQYKTLQ